MPEYGKVSPEEAEFISMMDAMTNALQNHKPYEKYLGPIGSRRLLLGGLQAYAQELEKQRGLRINIAPNGLAVAIQDKELHLNAQGTAQKHVVGNIWTPGLGFTLAGAAKNSIDKKDRITVHKLTVNPAQMFIWNVQGLVDTEMKGWGLYRHMRTSLNEGLGKKGLESTSFWLRVTSSDKLYLYVEGRPRQAAKI